jgi:23S rRNA pseudouridine2605 synthase
MHDSSTRLNKFLALQLGISRREADDLIAAGKVSLQNATAKLGARLREGDVVTVEGKPVTASADFTYLALNKPVGYVCSRKAQGDNPTIYSLLQEEYHHLKPVGRIDKDSSGLILLTNDGDFAYSMTHPKFQKIKVYEVELDKDLEPLHQQMINDHGITLPDGNSKLTLERLSETDRKAWRVTMSEGRNRQIRRTFSALGYEVTKLRRVQFGMYQLGALKSGAHAVLEKH